MTRYECLIALLYKNECGTIPTSRCKRLLTSIGYAVDFQPTKARMQVLDTWSRSYFFVDGMEGHPHVSL